MMKPILFLAVCAAAPALAADEMPQPIAGTRLDISATADVTRPPDIARIGAGVVTQADSAVVALRDNAARMTATVAALRRAGVAAADIQTSAITLTPRYRYADNQPPTLTGYEASNRVSVRLRGVERVGPTIDALVAAGANQLDGPNFEVEDPKAALDEARTKAIAEARARATLYARATGLSVRRIVRIDEQSAGGGQPVRPMMLAMRKADATPVEAGEQTLSVTVQVTFELG
ncbi:SIMPL domain-containing protein [Sphingomonas nostoxanthinifaciens]|uniref:SIMPL domain-containing protein n=1 Tax=Sphingomonas nostoxanthinifaciens TaxID=2872652 RepID=UPI001CC21F40|nr:SIMPL domain-containing protein [Sphingomonas nostoxanthinifaciens]UAK24877.1 SIMPL domain-containing protein [Sphingomonas nostoxanthinifaciens]